MAKLLKNDLPELASRLSGVYGLEVRLLGPYDCSDGRKRVDIRPVNSEYRSNSKCRTVQLARILLEIKLDRCLTGEEVVDHIDNDHTNDLPDNLQVLSKRENSGKRSAAGQEAINASLRSPEYRRLNSSQRTGELNPMSKLTDADARMLRHDFYKSRDFRKLQSECGVSRRSLKNCLSGTTYPTAGGPVFTLKELRVVNRTKY